MNKKQNNISESSNIKNFIICGGGMSGLSLAFYLNRSEKLRNKRILIIEPEQKNKNDRTWAFWQQEENAFENILFKKWNKVAFTSQEGEKMTLDLGKYHYKLLRGIDFYEFVLNDLKQNPNIEWLQDSVLKIEDEQDFAKVITQSGKEFIADFVFDSTFKPDLTNTKNHNLLQHFKGWVIETKEPVFDVELPDMMNFSVEQKNDECRFIYVLPHTPTRALIEYTLFSEALLPEKEYDAELENYIKKQLNITDYQMLETEFGVIPMSDVAIQEFPSLHLIRIGTAGGYTNPATGYTFSNTQKKLKELVAWVEKYEENGEVRGESGEWRGENGGKQSKMTSERSNVCSKTETSKQFKMTSERSNVCSKTETSKQFKMTSERSNVCSKTEISKQFKMTSERSNVCSKTETSKQFKMTSERSILGIFWQKRHLLYASILLNVLQKKRHLAADIFKQLYSKNAAALIFSFLDRETTFIQEIKIMSTTPIKKFLVATLDVIYKKIFYL